MDGMEAEAMSSGPSGHLALVHSVSFCIFDKALGNAIQCTYPPGLDLTNEIDCKSLADFCFPDGAHDSVVDYVHLVLPTRRGGAPPSLSSSLHASPTGDWAARSCGATLSTRKDERMGPSDERAGPSDGPLFGFACYHLQKDATVSRGATQRSLLILTYRPLGALCEAIAAKAIVPKFEATAPDDSVAHAEFAEKLFHCLRTCLNAALWPSGPAQGDGGEAAQEEAAAGQRSASPQPRIFGGSDDADEMRTPSTVSAPSPALSSPPQCTDSPRNDVLRGSFMATAPPGVVANTSLHERLQQHRADSRMLSMHFPIALVLPDTARSLVECKAPLPTASLIDQLSFGTSVKNLLRCFREEIAVVHWCLLCRIPVLFVGPTASEVGAAVRACVHLLRPIDVDVSRFVPYATIDFVDRVMSTISSSRYLAIGATNAYVTHRSFAGVAKADVSSGTVSFHASSSTVFGIGSGGVAVPRRHAAAFTELLAAARDDAVRECYFRARLEELNRNIALEVRVTHAGHYYDALCHRGNLIDAPLSSSGELLVIRNDSSTSSGFLIIDDVSSGAVMRRADDKLRENAALLPTAEGNCDVAVSSIATDAGTGESANAAAESQDAMELERLHYALSVFEGSARKNYRLLNETHQWYRYMFKYFVITLLSECGPAQNRLFGELKGFAPKRSKEGDDSLWSCGSDTVSALTFQQQIDRNARLRIVIEYHERVYMLIDALSKNNVTALLRPVNRRFSDFFNFRGCRQYLMQQQVLLFTTTCNMTLYVNRVTIKSGATLYISKNYICLEASRLTLHRRHQIFPFDIVSGVRREGSSVFGVTVRVMFDFPGGSTAMLVISNASSSAGLFELLHALWQKQRRLVKLLADSPRVHAIPDDTPITADDGTQLVCPRIVPHGVYTAAGAEVTDEVWENQRHYPIVGWSERLLPSDPPRFSDFSGVRGLPLETVDLPDGFRWTSEWMLACYVDTLTTDKLLLALEHRNDNPDAAEDTASDIAERIERLSPLTAKAKKEDLGFLYATHWTASRFKAKWAVGLVVRRRLWIRTRALLSPDPDPPPAMAVAEEDGKIGNNNTNKCERRIRGVSAAALRARSGSAKPVAGPMEDSLSTDDEDVVECGGERGLETSIAEEGP